MTSPSTAALALVLAVHLQLHCLGHGISYRVDQLRLRGGAAGAGAASATPCRVRGRDNHVDVMHGQQIERADPCEFCICIDSNVFCWWGQRHCDTAAPTRLPVPRRDNATNTAADAVSRANMSPEEEEDEEEKEEWQGEGEAPSNSTCTVMGREYAAGATLPRETGTCLECVCGEGGRVTCSPKDCVRDPPDSDDDHDSDASLDMFDVDIF